MEKMMMRLSAAAAMMALACGSALADSDSRECSNATLEGKYLFAASGFAFQQAGLAPGTWAPKAIIEYIHFNGDTVASDGHGTLTVLAATVANRTGDGQVLPSPPGTGTYKVLANCTATLTFTNGPSFNIITSPKGDEAGLIQTNPNNVLQGNLKQLVKDDD